MPNRSRIVGFDLLYPEDWELGETLSVCDGLYVAVLCVGFPLA